LTTDVYSIESWSKKKSSSRYQNARKDTIGTKLLQKTAAQGLGLKNQTCENKYTQHAAATPPPLDGCELV
jgi:hypothetical protein